MASSDASGHGSNKVLDAIGGWMGVWPDVDGCGLSGPVAISESGCRLSGQCEVC